MAEFRMCRSVVALASELRICSWPRHNRSCALCYLLLLISPLTHISKLESGVGQLKFTSHGYLDVEAHSVCLCRPERSRNSEEGTEEGRGGQSVRSARRLRAQITSQVVLWGSFGPHCCPVSGSTVLVSHSIKAITQSSTRRKMCPNPLTNSYTPVLDF